MTDFTPHVVEQDTRFNSFVVGALTIATLVLAGLLTFAQYIAI